ncbi:hypothetical protein PGB90_010041 [Kerria lacca]
MCVLKAHNLFEFGIKNQNAFHFSFVLSLIILKKSESGVGSKWYERICAASLAAVSTNIFPSIPR